MIRFVQSQQSPSSWILYLLQFVWNLKNDSNFSQIFQKSEISSRAQRSFHDKLSDLYYSFKLLSKKKNSGLQLLRFLPWEKDLRKHMCLLWNFTGLLNNVLNCAQICQQPEISLWIQIMNQWHCWKQMDHFKSPQVSCFRFFQCNLKFVFSSSKMS